MTERLSCRLDKSFLLCGFPLFFFLFTCGSILNCNLAKKPADFYITPATSKISVGICLNVSKAETHQDIATLLLGRRSVRATIVFDLYPRVGFLTWSRSVCAFPDHPIIRVLVPNRGFPLLFFPTYMRQHFELQLSQKTG